jgi:outer membrane protein OmpA-like peptidoglycan-associated protein
MSLSATVRFLSVGFTCLMLASCATQEVETVNLVDTSSQAVAAQLSTAQVQVFSLDDPAPASVDLMAASPSGMAMGIQGQPSGTDSSVTVFPLDGSAAASPMGTAGGLPSLMPPSSAAPMPTSPFPQPLTPEPVSMLHQAAPVQGQTVPAATIFFDHSSSKIPNSGAEVLTHVAQGFQQMPGTIFYIEGHASARAASNDPVERHISNLKIAMDRAVSVSRELMRLGVPAESIKTTAIGDVKPAKDEAQSRRVEILASNVSPF